MMCYLDIVVSPFEHPFFMGIALFLAVMVLCVVSVAVLIYVIVKEAKQNKKSKVQTRNQDNTDE